MSSQREREAVLLGLDLAFGVSAAAPKAQAAGAAGATNNKPPGLTEDEALLYAELPVTVVQEMEGQGRGRSGGGPSSVPPPASIDAALQGLLPASGMPSAWSASVEEKLKGRTVLLDNRRAQTEQQRQDVRARRRLLRGRVRLTARAVPEEGDRATMRTGRGAYEDYLGLHAAWKAYMARLLGISTGGGDTGEEDGAMAVDAASASVDDGDGGDEGEGEGSGPDSVDEVAPAQAAAPTPSSSSTSQPPFSSLTGNLAVERRVLSADLHGCLLRVVASRSSDDVGVAGLVVRESATAFHLISRKNNRVKVLPKAGRRFAFDLGGRTYVLHGTGLVGRAERVLASPLLPGGAGNGGGGGGAAADRRLLKTTRLA